jgi:hypothetical protein
MGTDSPGRSSSYIPQAGAFESIRSNLSRQSFGSATLLELLVRINCMEQNSASPCDFKVCFDEFVTASRYHEELVRPFFPMLVQFLPSHREYLALCSAA